MAFDLKDYVDVAERVAEFRTKHPEGSLQSEVIRWPEEGFPFVVVQAWAYRDMADTRPGVGLAQENFPGLTPYTKNSEVQNAETSAWGRAIVAALAADTKRGIASKQEASRAGSEGGSASSPRGRATKKSPGPAQKSEGGGSEGHGEGPPPSPDCKHEETRPLRPGWVLCESCRVAFKEGEVP